MESPVDGTWRISAGEPVGLSDYLLYRRHLFAYETACRTAGTWSVAVDLGCGLGIGASLLSQHGAKVIAIDMASTVLAGLREDVLRVQADAASLPLPDHSADLLVSFQLIEHVPRETAVAILTEIRRVLRPGGVGCLTTPNARWRLLPGQRPWNPTHVREYRPREILGLCEEAGLRRRAISGIVGRYGAQAAERARVRQSPLLAYGGRYGMRLRQVLRSLAPRMRRRLDLEAPPVTAEHRALDWFDLSLDYENGLDFWIEVRGG